MKRARRVACRVFRRVSRAGSVFFWAKVIAVDAAEGIAKIAEKIVKANHFADTIDIVCAKVREEGGSFLSSFLLLGFESSKLVRRDETVEEGVRGPPLLLGGVSVCQYSCGQHPHHEPIRLWALNVVYSLQVTPPLPRPGFGRLSSSRDR